MCEVFNVRNSIVGCVATARIARAMQNWVLELSSQCSWVRYVRPDPTRPDKDGTTLPAFSFTFPLGLLKQLELD
jgi:hypothetical protein